MSSAPRPAQLPQQPFRAFFREHYAFVWRCVRRMGVGAAELDDVTQEVFVIAHRERDEFQGRSSIKTWLYGIAVNRARMHLRGQARRLQRRREGGDNLVAPPPSDLVTRHAAVDLLDRLVSRLCAEQREVFILLELEDLPAKEVADQLQVSINTVHSRLRLARRKIALEVRRMRARREEGSA